MNSNLVTRKMSRTKFVVTVGVFAAIAFILQMFGSFLKSIGISVGGFLEVEFSEVPALIISMAYGPLAGIVVELLKNIIHCFVTTTGFVGEFANFVINGILCFSAGIIYKYNKTYKGGVMALLCSSLIMAITSVFVNRFIMLPLYMPQAEEAVMANIIATTIFPFNVARGLLLTFLTMVLYKRISRIIK